MIHLFLLLSQQTLRATLGVLELPIIMFISSTHSHIESLHLVDFTHFGAPFVLFSLEGDTLKWYLEMQVHGIWSLR